MSSVRARTLRASSRDIELRRMFQKGACETNAGGIDEHVGVTALLRQCLFESGDSLGARDIHWKCCDRDLVFIADASGGRLQHILSPGDQHQVIACSRKPACQGKTDAFRCTGDDRHRLEAIKGR